MSREQLDVCGPDAGSVEAWQRHVGQRRDACRRCRLAQQRRNGARRTHVDYAAVAARRAEVRAHIVNINRSTQ